MKRQSVILLTAMSLAIGLVLGALWHWSYRFPFPQVSALKSQITGQRRIPGLATGRWVKIPRRSAGNDVTEEMKERMRQLQTIGYLAGSRPAPDRQGVTVHDSVRAYEGLNLVVSGHAAEAILMTMSGEEIHRWACDVPQVWPDFEPEERLGHDDHQVGGCWRRAQVMENGDLLAIFDGIGIIKLDKDSNLLWSTRNGAHHDLYVTKRGDIYVLAREAHINERFNPQGLILEDYVSILDPQGNEVKRISLLEILEKSPYAPTLNRLNLEGDVMHSNTIEVIEDPGRLPFDPGTVLVSIRYLDLVCVVDLERETVLWGESDFWRQQHQPTLLANGNMLVLDNLATRNTSSVLELDPISREIFWSYAGDDSTMFYTPTCGSCQRLANGNTLITESDPGRAFEVTPGKEIVWEYLNPHRAGPHDELVATLFEVVRLPSDFPLDWLQ